MSQDVHEERRWLNEVLEVLPAEPRAQEALCTSYRQAQEWEALVFCVTRFFREGGGDFRKTRSSLGGLSTDRGGFGGSRAGDNALESCSRPRTGADQANNALERLYLQVERYEELIDFYLEQISAADANELFKLRHSAGVVLIDRLSRFEDGVDLLVGNLTEEYAHPPTLDYVENMMADASFSTLDEGVSLAVLSALSTVYESSERWSDWFIVRELLADRIDDVREKVSVRLEVVERQTTLESIEVAFESLKRLFFEFPEDELLYERLLEFSTQHDNWMGFCDLVEDVLEENPGLSSAETYLTKLRDVYADDQDGLFDDRLKHACVRLLMFDDSEVSALHTLVTLSEDNEQWADCIKWFTRLSEHADTPYSETECFLRIADYQANASDEEGQLEALRTAFESAPESLEILDRMIEIKSESRTMEEVAPYFANVLSYLPMMNARNS